jgi:predicted phosphodiesterase
MICHGDSLSYSQGIRPDMAGVKLDACLQSGSFSELICGHTHIPMNFVHRGVRFLNFGSVSTPTEGGHHASYGILDLSARRDMRFRQIPFDLEPYARDMKQTGFPGMERVLRRYAGQA